MTNERTINEALNLSGDVAEVIRDAREIQEKCSDYGVNSNDILMSDDLRIHMHGTNVPLSELATGHICGKFKIPTAYFNRLAEVSPQLAAENMNLWLQHNPKSLLLREYDGRIRGVLSGSYSKFDAPEILEAVDSVVGFENYRLKGSFINEERLHLRMVESQPMNIDGEDLFAGFTLDSSDVGRSGLYVRFFVWKQVCTNGLCIAKSSGELFRQKHVGITSEDFRTSLVAGLENYEAVKAAITESIIETKHIPVTADIEKLAEELKTKTLLSDDVVEEVIMMMDTKYDRSRFGLINGITEVAQRYTLDRRIQLETIAASMLAK